MANLNLFSFFSKKTRKNYRLFIGLNDKNTLIQEISTQEARGIIARVCGDCTLSEAAGVCEALKIALNQELIAVMEVKNPTTFI